MLTIFVMLQHFQVILKFSFLPYPKTFHILHDVDVEILVFHLQPNHLPLLNP